VPLEHILRAMQVQANGEIEKISRAADEEATQLIAEAESAARAIRARHRDRVEPLLATEAAGLQNKAKLGALRAFANAREELIVQAFNGVVDCFAQIRASKQYPEIFRALAQEAVQGLENNLIVRVDARDTALARAVLRELGVNAEIAATPIPLGGLEVSTRDERIVIVNTLAARLERSRALVRGPVARLVSQEEKWTTVTSTPMPV
jgi:V/A-type H+-transporting ATPase subunit E